MRKLILLLSVIFIADRPINGQIIKYRIVNEIVFKDSASPLIKCNFSITIDRTNNFIKINEDKDKPTYLPITDLYKNLSDDGGWEYHYVCIVPNQSLSANIVSNPSESMNNDWPFTVVLNKTPNPTGGVGKIIWFDGESTHIYFIKNGN